MSQEDILEALFAMNKYAKDYATQSQKAYQSGWKEQARIYSLRKSALYDYKSHILTRLYERGWVDNVEYHQIDDRMYYCFYINNYSFHVPEDEITDLTLSFDSEASDISSEYNATSNVESLDISERKCLVRLDQHFESANDFLYPKFVSSTYKARPIGWEYLSGYVEEGETATEEEVLESQFSEYCFDVGDVFETTEAEEVQILDRYGAWLTGWSHFDDTVHVRPVYDVIVGDEHKEAVPQYRICEDWRINLQDTVTAAGVTRISGEPWEKYLLPRLEKLPDLHVGDRLVFDDDAKATIEHIETNDCVLVFVRLVFENEEFDEYLAPDEFMDDVKTIHRCDKEINV